MTKFEQLGGLKAKKNICDLHPPVHESEIRG